VLLALTILWLRVVGVVDLPVAAVVLEDLGLE
jgi:hypothetical protein